MKHLLTGAAALALTASGALAAGLDRSGQSVSAIFNDEGASLSFGMVIPSVTGKDAAGNSYDVGENYTQLGLSYTNKVGEKLSYAVIFDNPFGADVSYNNSPLTSTLGGTGADLSSEALSFVLRYNVTDRISVFGGVKAQRVRADVQLNGTAYRDAITASAIARGFNATRGAGTPELSASGLAGVLGAGRILQTPGATAEQQAAAQQVLGQFAATYSIPAANLNATVAALGTQFTNQATAFAANGGYRFEMENSTRPGYLIGAAYEIPEIAFRLAATYHAEIEHKADTDENLFGIARSGKVTYKTPRSFNLEFQTGIAADTLLTASYRWTEFSATDVVPALLGSDLVNLNDGRRYTLGVGRRINESLSGSVSLSYEPKGDSLVSPLGPSNGLFGLSIGARYSEGNYDISGGINYSWLGDAKAEVGGVSQASFKDNHAVGVGFKVDFKF